MSCPSPCTELQCELCQDPVGEVAGTVLYALGAKLSVLWGFLGIGLKTQFLVALLIPMCHPEELEATQRHWLITAEALLVTKWV